MTQKYIVNECGVSFEAKKKHWDDSGEQKKEMWKENKEIRKI